MKKVLIALVVILLVAAMCTLGYLLMDSLLPASPMGQAVAVSASGTPPSQAADINVLKVPETGADILDAITSQLERNKDTVGWLTVPGTRIDGPVLQSFDNAYYLRRNEKKEADVYGCYFADCTSSLGDREVLSPNTVVYGHSDLTDNAEGPRFSQLFKFTDEEFARRHPVIRFSTLEAVMEWEIFAVFYTDTGFGYIQTQPDGPGLTALAEEAKARSLYRYATEVGEEDKILTLSTCTIKYGAEEKEQRFVVMARLLPQGTEAPAAAELAPNPAPKEPVF